MAKTQRPSPASAVSGAVGKARSQAGTPEPESVEPVAARRARTPPPAAVSAAGRAPTPDGIAASAGRARTPPPQPVPGPAEDVDPGGPLREQVKEKVDQLWYLQDLLHNPVPFNLRDKYLDTSSTPAQIEARKSEVRYQMQMLRAVLTILSDELKMLEQAKPVTGQGDPNGNQA
jgi:hypothetical protein